MKNRSLLPIWISAFLALVALSIYYSDIMGANEAQSGEILSSSTDGIIEGTDLKVAANASVEEATIVHGAVGAEAEVMATLGSVLPDSSADYGWYEEALLKHVTVLNSFQPSESSNDVTYVQTNLKYPWLRIEPRQIKVDGRLVEYWDAVVGDHLLLRKHAEVSEDQLREALAAESVHIISALSLPDTYLVAYELSEEEDVLKEKISALFALEEFVDFVEADSLVVKGGSPEQQPALTDGRQWALHNTGAGGGLAGSDIDALLGWSTLSDASNVVVAVVDTGINYFHEDLVDNIWKNEGEISDNGIDDDGNDYVDDVYGIDPHNNDADPADDNGHGTHCAGIIGADGYNNVGMSGVAPRVHLMGLKFLSSNGFGYTSDSLEAISYAKDNGADVLNLSWGGRSYSALLKELLQDCTERGIIAVAAAGNDGDNIDNRPVYPAAYDVAGLMTIASVDDFDQLSGFSNYGLDTVDLAAPGSNILSTWIGPGDPYKSMSGTSMAAPHVSGVLALLRANFPNDSVEETTSRLLNGCEQLSGLNESIKLGRRLNLQNALVATERPHNDAPSGADVSQTHAAHWLGINKHAATELGDEARPASVWYRWTPPAGGIALVQFSGPSGVYFDLMPQSSQEAELLLQAKEPGQYIFEASPNSEYLIVVYGDPAQFRIDVSIPPVNDNRDDATPVFGREWSHIASSLGATSEPGEARVGYESERSVWWRWTAPESGAVRIDTLGSDFDTVLSVFAEDPLGEFIQGERPDITFVVDRSGSTRDQFGGYYLGDQNNDGLHNTVLDAEIAAISNLLNYISESEVAETSRVSVVGFEGNADFLDLNSDVLGIQKFVSPGEDNNTNGIPDVIESLSQIRAGGGTNYRAALEKVETGFAGLSPGKTANMLFFSDGKPTMGGAYTDVVQRLRADNTFIRAFGAGRNSSLGALIVIDPKARIYSSADEFGQLITGALAYNDDIWPELTSEVNLTVEAGKTYFIKVSGYDGESGKIQLNGTIFDGLEIISSPESQPLEYGSNLHLSTQVRGVRPLTYQWFLNGVAIEGADRPGYSITESDDSDAGDYQMMVSNTFGYLMTDVASIQLFRDPPRITSEPIGQKIVPGSTISLQVEARGTEPLFYQWYFEDVLIPGAVAKTYQLNSFAEAQQGRYTARVSNEAGEVESNPALLQLSDAPFENWRYRHASGPKINIESTAAFGDYFYLFGDRRVVRTTDGIAWEETSLPISDWINSYYYDIKSVRVMNGLLVATYAYDGREYYYYSSNGMDWEPLLTPANSSGLSEYNGKWFLNGIVDSEPVFLSSDDLENWEVVDALDPNMTLTLVEQGSEWRYLVDGVPMSSSSWQLIDNFSGSWPSGQAELGYGEGDETTVIPYVSTRNTAYFQLPFKNEPGFDNYDVWGRVKYDTTIRVRMGNNVIFSDSTISTTDPQGDWVDIPLFEDALYTYAGRPSPFSVEFGKASGDTSMSFDMELFASTHAGLRKAVPGDDRVIVLKGNGDVYVSFDGESWTSHTTTGLVDTSTSEVASLPFTGPPRFLLGKFVCSDPTGDVLYLSDDGIDWQAHAYPQVTYTFPDGHSEIRTVSLDQIGAIVEHNGQLLLPSARSLSYTFLLVSPDFLNWTAENVERKEGFGTTDVIMGNLTSNGTRTFASFRGSSSNTYGAANFGVFASPEDVNISQVYQGFDVERLRIVDGHFLTFPDYNGRTAKISQDSNQWRGFSFNCSDAVYHDGFYYALKRSYDGSTHWIMKESAIEGNSTVDWLSAGSQVTWPFTWAPWTLNYFNGRFVAAGHRGGVATSIDGVNWELRQAASDALGMIVHSEVLNGIWCGLTNDGAVVTSTDGVDFVRTVVTASPVVRTGLGGIAAAAYGNGTYIICVENDNVPEMYRSNDAIHWTKVEPGTGASPTGVAYGGGWFVAVANGKLYYSNDGVTWDAGSINGSGGSHVVYHMDSFWVSDDTGVFWSTKMASIPEVPKVTIETVEATHLFNSQVRVAASVEQSNASFSKLEFYVDGELVYDTTDTSITWETNDLSPGDHYFVIKVYDEYGRPTTEKIETAVVFSDFAEVMPGALRYIEYYFQSQDGAFYGLGDEFLARSIDGRDWREIESIHAIDDLGLLRDFAELSTGVKLILDSSGNLILSRDDISWRRIDDAGIQGRLFSNGELVFATGGIVDGGRISYSADGINWQESSISVVGGNTIGSLGPISQVEFWNESFVAYQRGGGVAVSPDGINWTLDNSIPLVGWDPRIVFGEEQFVLFSSYIGNTGAPDFERIYDMRAYVSDEDLNWTALSEKTDMQFRNLQSVDGVFYGINEEGIWSSLNLSDWELLAHLDQSNDFLLETSLHKTDSGYFAVRSSNSVYDYSATLAESSDMINWTRIQDFSTDGRISRGPKSLDVVDGTFVTNVGTDLLKSTNGRNWVACNVGHIDDIRHVEYLGDHWVAVGADSKSEVLRIVWSSDLDVWEYAEIADIDYHPTYYFSTYFNFLYQDGIWLFVHDRGVVRSTDLTNWVTITPPAEKPFSDHIYNEKLTASIMGGRFILFHPHGFFSSIDGQNWNFLYTYLFSHDSERSPENYRTHNLRFVDGYYVYPSVVNLVNPTNTHVRSLDLTEWEEASGNQELVDVPNPITWVEDVGMAEFPILDDNGLNRGSALFLTFDGGLSYAQASDFGANGMIVASEDSFYIGTSSNIREFSLVDLIVENTTIDYSETPGPDVPIEVGFDVVNKGFVANATERQITISVLLTSNDSLDVGSSILLFETTLDSSLAAGESLHFSQEVYLPRELPAGDFYLEVYVDSEDQLSELNEENNIYISPNSLVDVPSLTLTINPAVGGMVLAGSTLPQGLALSGQEGGLNVLSGNLELPYNLQLNLVAKAAKGYEFAGWAEFPDQADAPLNVSMTENLSLTPQFNRVISLSVVTQGGGSVQTSPTDTSDLTMGQEVSLQATPDEGWSFLEWQGDLDSTSPAESLIVNSSRRISAVFYRNELSFDDWKQDNFSIYEIPNRSMSDVLVDVDGDGFSNLLEYMFKTHPKKASERPEINYLISRDRIEFNFETDPRIRDYKVVIYSSQNLKDWNPAIDVEDRMTDQQFDRAKQHITTPVDRNNFDSYFYQLRILPVE